jgi:hypothetical protein
MAKVFNLSEVKVVICYSHACNEQSLNSTTLQVGILQVRTTSGAAHTVAQR